MLTHRWSRTARKCLPYTIEPPAEGPTCWWEGFCTTNPTLLRLPGDERIFLGYRAAGTATSFHDGSNLVWGSSLGLAILNSTGELVLHRFPLPIVYCAPPHPLPQDRAGYDEYIAKHGQAECLLHDFRFWPHDDRLYLIYHAAGLNRCRDCVAWMPLHDFKTRVEASLALLARCPDPAREDWQQIWWQPETWQPAGVDGTPYIYAGPVNKNDIVFFKRADGSLRMSHRPYPDMACIETGMASHAVATPDGLTRYGTIERCIRPGFFDNGHIGPNGAPTPALLGEIPIYIEITHGVHDRALTSERKGDGWELIYMPYLRVSDRATGAELYYSEDPIIDYDDTWREYVEDGAWVRRLAHLRGVMFPGGQLPVDPARINLDDEFMFFTGVGDTAVARAVFTLRQLLPAAVIEDVLARPAHARHAVAHPAQSFPIPAAISGWEWMLCDAPDGRGLAIQRKLGINGHAESASAPVLPRPGYFDADALCWLAAGPRLVEGLGWVGFYHGVRWFECDGKQRTQSGIGVVLLDPENLERILYRAGAPLAGTAAEADGWLPADPWAALPAAFQHDPCSAIPAGVQAEWRRIQDLIARRLRDRSHHTRWLLQKSGKLAD